MIVCMCEFAKSRSCVINTTTNTKQSLCIVLESMRDGFCVCTICSEKMCVHIRNVCVCKGGGRERLGE